MNLAQASPAELMAAFAQDATAFLAQFEQSLREANNAAETLQALGHAGEALRGVRIGAEFLGLDAMAMLCRQGEQDLLEQLPQISGGRPVRWTNLEQIITGLRRQLQAASPPTEPPPPKPGLQPASEGVNRPDLDYAEQSKTSDVATPVAPFAPAASAAELPTEAGAGGKAGLPEETANPSDDLQGTAAVAVPSSTQTSSPLREALPTLQPHVAADGAFREATPPEASASLAVNETLLQRLAEIPDLLREQIESWKSLREALEAGSVSRNMGHRQKMPDAEPNTPNTSLEPDVATEAADAGSLPKHGEADSEPDVGPDSGRTAISAPPQPGARIVQEQQRSGEEPVIRKPPWNARIDVRLARLRHWLLALPSANVLGLIPQDGQVWQLPRGDELLLTEEEGAVPTLALGGDWDPPDPTGGCSVLLQHGGRFFALRVDACLSTQSLHFWSIPVQIGGRHGIEAAAALPQANSPAMPLLLSMPFLASMVGTADRRQST